MEEAGGWVKKSEEGELNRIFLKEFAIFACNFTVGQPCR